MPIIHHCKTSTEQRWTILLYPKPFDFIDIPDKNIEEHEKLILESKNSNCDQTVAIAKQLYNLIPVALNQFVCLKWDYVVMVDGDTVFVDVIEGNLDKEPSLEDVFISFSNNINTFFLRWRIKNTEKESVNYNYSHGNWRVNTLSKDWELSLNDVKIFSDRFLPTENVNSVLSKFQGWMNKNIVAWCRK